ncbi:MAG: hypothetical protein QNJ71_09670 [Acidimicrobiia bacterium]|nr:hypothetical protein [Acidimicrobiia bacterium]
MAHLISFRTDLFDPAAEPENPINPIAGQSALVWIRDQVLADVCESTEPDYEDWGWYIEVPWDGGSYTVGAICFDEDDGSISGDGADSDPSRKGFEWMVQVVKRRRFSDVMRRKNAMKADDGLTTLIVDALRADPAFEDVAVEFGR